MHLVHRYRDLLIVTIVIIGAALVALLTFNTTPATAFSSGQTLHSGNPDFGGGATCAQCHSGSSAAASVSISGPSILDAGTTGRFTVSLVGGPAVVGGFNASTSGHLGTLAAVDGRVQILDDEATHTSPAQIGGSFTSWDFEWTAPTDASTVTMYAAAVSADNDGSNQGDTVAATTFQVSVLAQAEPTATPTPTATTGGGVEATPTVAPTAVPTAVPFTTPTPAPRFRGRLVAPALDGPVISTGPGKAVVGAYGFGGVNPVPSGPIPAAGSTSADDNTVAGTGGAAELALTGPMTSLLGSVAIVLVASGACLVTASRRRDN